MKATLLSFLALTVFSIGIFAQNVNIPDPMFKNYLVTNTAINTNEDDEIQESEASTFAGTMDCSNKYITDLTGIEAFTALTELKCSENGLTTLDITQNTSLSLLRCSWNDITSLYLPQGTALKTLTCDRNELESIDVSQSTALEILDCSNNNLTVIDVSQNPELNILKCAENTLTTLDVTQNTALKILSCDYNNLTVIDVSQNNDLTDLNINNNNLTVIDLTQNPVFKALSCANNELTALDFTQNPNLGTLLCPNNFISALDLSQNPMLSTLYGYNNSLTSLNVANGSNEYMFSFQVYNNPDLECIEVDNVEYSNTYWTYIDSTATFSTNCGGPVGVEEKTTVSNLSIYPNPVRSQITIDAPDQIETVHIYNLIGELVQTNVANTFSVADLSNGVYILKIKTNVETLSIRFVKSN